MPVLEWLPLLELKGDRNTLRDALIEFYFEYYPHCDCCGAPLVEPQLHEGIVTRADFPYKNKKPIFHIVNLFVVNSMCHISHNLQSSRQDFWDNSVARYGEKAVTEWYNGLPWKVVPRLFQTISQS